jgi:hypothetical protein
MFRSSIPPFVLVTNVLLAVGTLAGCSGASPESIGAEESAIATPQGTTNNPLVSCTVSAQVCDSNTAETTNFSCEPVSGTGVGAYSVQLLRGINGGTLTQVASTGTQPSPLLTPIALSDTFPLAAASQSVKYWVCTEGSAGQRCSGQFTITSLAESNCETLAGTGGGCPKGEAYDLAENKCVACNNAACACRLAGGEWDGKTCQ